MYPLIETICILDGEIQNLEWHQKRYETSYEKMYAKTSKSKLVSNLNIPKEYTAGISKLRISYNEKSKRIEIEKYTPNHIKTLKLVFTNSIDYSLKYANRTILKALLAEKGNCDDILIIKNGMVTDASYANIVFTDGKKWFTPNSPLLKGTCRARLLSEKRIMEIDISTGDLSRYIGFQLINAMNDLNESKYIQIENIVA
ncbi:aminotransferase class IV [Aurantibacter sp.]|uniref:aminotransferase class IV n=1 Tax=Aurantibacter sp. TaxID=2807103 RepID=UPI003263AE75